MYTANFGGSAGTAVTVAQDLFEIMTSGSAVACIHRVTITQKSDTDSEQLSFSISRSTGSSGSGGETKTAVAILPGDLAFGGTIEANNTTRATTLTKIHAEAQNILNGWDFYPTPENRVWVQPSGRVVVSLEAPPVDSLDMIGTMWFEEIG